MFKIIPFGWLPSHWGTAGKTRAIMKAEYEFADNPFARDIAILTARKDEFTEIEFQRKIIDIRKKYNQYNNNDDEYERDLADLIQDPVQKELTILELDYKAGKIKDNDYAKKVATLKNEPWVIVLNMDVAKGSSLEGSFELDWNQAFVDKLKQEGYNGPTADKIVNAWFMELCRNIAMEEFDGTGDFTPDSEANLDAVKRWNTEHIEIGKGRKAHG